jgi:hypothetical protein
MSDYIRWLEHTGLENLAEVGASGAWLGELRKEEFSIPEGFVLVTRAFDRFLEENGLIEKAKSCLGPLDLEAGQDLQGRAEELGDLVVRSPVPVEIAHAIEEAGARLLAQGNGRRAVLAVRSSIAVRDRPEVFLPTQPEFFLDLQEGGAGELLLRVRECWASAWSYERLVQAVSQGLDPFSLMVTPLVQLIPGAETAGRLQTSNPANAAHYEMVIHACWGVGEAVLPGRFEADEFVVRREPVELLDQKMGNKERMLVPGSNGSPALREIEVDEDRAEMPCLTWEQIREIAGTGKDIERLLGSPLVMEWSLRNGDLTILGVSPAAAPAAPGAPSAPGEGGEGEEPPQAGGPQDNGDASSEAEVQGGSAPAAASAASFSPNENARPAGRAGTRRSKMEKYPDWKLAQSGKLRAKGLSSLFTLGRRAKKQGGPVRPQDEFHHPHQDAYHWNESYYFNFTDPDRGMGGFSRIGMVPNQDVAIGILYIFLPDGGILMLTQSEPCRASRDEIGVGLLRYERVQPLREWRIRFEGEMLCLPDPRRLLTLVDPPAGGASEEDLEFRQASVDLRFRGWSDCHNFKDADADFVAERFVNAGSRLRDLMAVTKVASEHYEQVGEWSGEVVIAGEKFPIRGSGHRDHSWGERDWKAPERWTWLTAQFGADFGFNLSRVVIKSLDIYNGYVCRAGKNFSLRRAWLATEFEGDGRTQKRVRVRLQDVSGWEAEVEGIPQTVVPLTLRDGAHRTLVNEALTEYEWRGRRGFGISEYLHQLPP